MAPSNSMLAVGLGSVLAVAAVATLARPKNEKSAIVEINEDEDEDNIMETDVCKIFDRLFLEMQNVLGQLSQHIQRAQMAGQVIPEQQLRQILKSEFLRALAHKQAEVFEEFGVDEDCLKEATWEMLNDEKNYPKAKIAVERFQRLYENLSGEKIVGKRPGGKASVEDEPEAELLEPKELLVAAEFYFQSLTDSMGELIKRYKEEGKNLNSPVVAQSLQMEFASVANDAGESALQSKGITLAQFQKSIEKNASNPEVGRALAMLQMKQQQELVAMGLPG